MPEVRRGSLQLQSGPAVSPTETTTPPLKLNHPSTSQSLDTSSNSNSKPDPSPVSQPKHTNSDKPPTPTTPTTPTTPRAVRIFDPRSYSVDVPRQNSDRSIHPPRRNTLGPESSDAPRQSLSYAQRPNAEAYYDSRAGTRREFRRRAKDLQEYYEDNPELLPQLPFTWHHGWKRWKLWIFAFLVFVDASAVPIALYYGMFYAGDVEGWIIFAVVTTIWGGPTYLEFAIRTLRLIKKERFYRPLGAESRWSFDMLTWASTLTITVVTALFVIGSAPHNVWLRVLCMPAPAILYCLGGVLALITLYNHMDWPAPFRISSTAKGGKVLPGIYYFVEDVVAVNAGAGLPYREALAARYKASPRFRRMLYIQSIFWSIPSLILAIPLTVISVHPAVPATAAYGVCWAVPFLWAGVWGLITIKWCKRDMVRERIEWQTGVDFEKGVPESTKPSVVQ